MEPGQEPGFVVSDKGGAMLTLCIGIVIGLLIRPAVMLAWGHIVQLFFRRL